MSIFWALSKYFSGKDGSAPWKKMAAGTPMPESHLTANNKRIRPTSAQQ